MTLAHIKFAHVKRNIKSLPVPLIYPVV